MVYLRFYLCVQKSKAQWPRAPPLSAAAYDFDCNRCQAKGKTRERFQHKITVRSPGFANRWRMNMASGRKGVWPFFEYETPADLEARCPW